MRRRVVFASQIRNQVDAIRPRIWSNPNVDFWYAQNALLFADPRVLADKPSLKREWERSSRQQISMVHPTLFLRTAEQLEKTVDFRVRRVIGQAKQVVRRLLNVA